MVGTGVMDGVGEGPGAATPPPCGNRSTTATATRTAAVRRNRDEGMAEHLRRWPDHDPLDAFVRRGVGDVRKADVRGELIHALLEEGLDQ